MPRDSLDQYSRHPLLQEATVRLGQRFSRLAEKLGRKIELMEVCGTHTVAISRLGLRSLLGEWVNLRSGPGCPVCVTDHQDMDYMVELARVPGVMVATFGDMVRVPGTRGSLYQARAEGAEVRMVYSPLEAVQAAVDHPDRQVVFLGVGFETTAPTVLASLEQARKLGLKNYSIYSAHKVVPPALTHLFQGEGLRLDGLLLPGHVSTIIGRQTWETVPQLQEIPATVAGFEAVDLLRALAELARQIEKGEAGVTNSYSRVVTEKGNERAQELMSRWFRVTDASWRGLGVVPQSGLELREEMEAFEIRKRIDLAVEKTNPPSGCRCGEVLQGLMWPHQCPLFGSACTPTSPVGPCMVSSEGSCAAHYQYC